MKYALTRELLAKVLTNALCDFSSRQGVDGVLAAPLAARIRDLLRFEFGDPNFRLTGDIFGPVLYPALPHSHHLRLKFLDLLRAFPEIATVERLSTGVDSVKPARNSSVSSQAPGLTNGARQKLERQIPRRDAEPSKPSDGEISRAAYLFVDSGNFLNVSHELLPGRTNQKPNWHEVLKNLQERHPGDWKARYVMAPNIGKSANTSGFETYLESNGFLIVRLQLERETVVLEETVEERGRVTGMALQKLLSRIIETKRNCHVFVVSHSGDIAPLLSDLLARRANEEVKIGVIGFQERFEEDLVRLKSEGLVFYDIETDLKGYSSPLPRSRLVSASTFNADEYL